MKKQPDDLPPLKIGYCDFWPGFDPSEFFITRVLSQHYTITIDNRSPQVLFYSVFGIRNLRFRGCKVLVNSEPHSVSYGRPDFAIGYRTNVNDKTLRLPVWAWDLDERLLIPASDRSAAAPHRFANFIYSNATCEYRNHFYSALSRRAEVDGLGAVHRTHTGLIVERTDQNWGRSKLAVLGKYRFTLAMENVRQSGYSTEKLTDAFRAGSIPIYWGDPFVAEDFDSRSFIDVSTFRSPREAIEYIMEIDSSEDARNEFLRHAPMTPEAWARYEPPVVASFLHRIAEECGDRRSRRRVTAMFGAGIAYYVGQKIMASQQR